MYISQFNGGKPFLTETGQDCTVITNFLRHYNIDTLSEESENLVKFGRLGDGNKIWSNKEVIGSIVPANKITNICH